MFGLKSMKHPKFKVLKLDWYCVFEHGSQPELYLEKCQDPGFPPREGVKYCVRLPGSGKWSYKPYLCYCFQKGVWWKYREIEFLFTDIYVPQIMSHYDYSKLNCPRRFLSEKARRDCEFYYRFYDLSSVYRNSLKTLTFINQFGG
jgi:hypothetical protein